MASRLDAIQVAVTRSPDTAAQTHAAQRQPINAQEQLTATNRQQAAARQERPEALARRDGSEVKNDLIPAVQDRDPRRRSPRRRQPSPAAGDSTDAARTYLRAVIGDSELERQEAFVSTAQSVVDLLEGDPNIELEWRPFPDYYARPGRQDEGTSGRGGEGPGGGVSLGSDAPQ